VCVCVCLCVCMYIYMCVCVREGLNPSCSVKEIILWYESLKFDTEFLYVIYTYVLQCSVNSLISNVTLFWASVISIDFRLLVSKL